MKKLFFSVIGLFLFTISFAQLKGRVVELDANKKASGLPNAIVQVKHGEFTVSDTAGYFSFVEAKKGDLDEGLGQCAAEMYAATIFNQQKNDPIETIYGAVTTGETWKFMKLNDHILSIQTNFTSLEHLDMILGLLLKMVTC